MAKVYNLSFDISEELIKKNQADQLDKFDVIKVMIQDGLIITNEKFNIYLDQRVVSRHIIVYPVRTTLIFHSDKSQDEIAGYLNRFNAQMYYIITNVEEDVSTYLARLHGDEELQQNFDDQLNEVIQNIMVGK